MRRITAVMLALGMAVGLSACGGKQAGQPKETTGAASGASKTTAAETDAPEKKTKAEDPVSMEDAELPADKDFIYDKFNSYVALRGYQGKDEVIVIPGTIEGLPVQLNGFTIVEKAHVRGIVIDEGYTSIPFISCESAENSPIESIKLPSTCTEVNSSNSNPFAELPYLSTIEVADGNPVYFVEDGILYANLSGGDKLLLCYPPMKEGEVFSQPDQTLLAEACFANNTALKRVENAHAKNGENAFLNSAVEEVVCSDSWTYLGQHEFDDYSGESKLRSITLSAKLNDLVWKTDHFKGQDKLEEINVPEGNPDFFSEDGILYYVGSSGTYLLKYPNAHPGEDFVVSEKADMLYLISTVFENPIYLKRVHIPEKWADSVRSSDLPNGIEVVVD